MPFLKTFEQTQRQNEKYEQAMSLIMVSDETNSRTVPAVKVRSGDYVWNGAQWTEVTFWEHRNGRTVLHASTRMGFDDGDQVTVHNDRRAIRDAIASAKIALHR